MQVLHHVDHFAPRWVVVENVIQMRRWSRYPKFLSALRTNFEVREEVLDAADFGVPQSRRRLFLICDRVHEPGAVEPSARTHTPARTILDPMGTWPMKPLLTSRRAKDTILRAERAIAEVGAREPFLLVYYGTDGGGGWQSLDRPLRTITTLDRFALVVPSRHGHQMRMLQVPELRRAMGFDPRFQLPLGTRRDRIKLLGNGVCPPVMAAIVDGLVHGRNAARSSLADLRQRRAG